MELPKQTLAALWVVFGGELYRCIWWFQHKLPCPHVQQQCIVQWKSCDSVVRMQ